MSKKVKINGKLEKSFSITNRDGIPDDLLEVLDNTAEGNDIVYKHFSIEINSDWLDEPESIKKISKVIKGNPKDFGYDFAGSGDLRVWCDITIPITITADIDEDEDLEEWLSDNHFNDLFMLCCDIDEEFVEAIDDSAEVSLDE